MKSAVMPPMIITNESAMSESSKSGDMRATMKIPAVTMVAAWMSAEMGVGPSMESGSQTCKGNWADLPMAPMKRQMQATAKSGQTSPGMSSMVSPAMALAAANASV